MNVPNRRTVTDALIVMLEAATGRPVGDFDSPVDGTEPVPMPVAGYPYLVVASIAGGGSTGSVASSADTLTIVYQLTAVGLRRDQAEALSARAHQAMLEVALTGGWAHPIAAAGHTVAIRVHDSSGGTDIDGPFVNAVERYALDVSALS